MVSKQAGPLKPPSGEMDHSDIGRPKGSMNEAAEWRNVVEEIRLCKNSLTISLRLR